MTELVRHDVGTFAREDGDLAGRGGVADGVVEERESLLDVLRRKVVARVVGVQIDAVVQPDRNRRADLADATARAPAADQNAALRRSASAAVQ